VAVVKNIIAPREKDQPQIQNHPQIKVDQFNFQSPTQQPLIGNTLYVSNLSREVKEKDLLSKFEEFGKVSSARVVIDPYTK